MTYGNASTLVGEGSSFGGAECTGHGTHRTEFVPVYGLFQPTDAPVALGEASKKAVKRLA